MRLIFADTETFWSSDHSLSKMSPIDYVLHERTQIISVAIKVGKAPTDVFFGEDKIRHVLSKLDFSDSMLVFHNASEFDAMIWAWRFGVKPKMWGCTLAMARPVHAKTTGLSLKALAQYYGLGVKDNTALVNTKGKRLEDFTPAELAAMEEYNREDTDLCAKLFYKLAPTISADEMFHLDCNIRMLVEPKFVVDRGLLETALSIERANKYKALLDLAQQLGYTWNQDDPEDGRTAADVYEFVREQLASAPKFSALLESLGIEVPMKPSPTNPEKRVPALAKTDEAFVALQDHPNPIVAAAARARLDVKSTLLETRIGKFIETSDRLGGLLPVPLRYCGADTTGRDSGQLFNPQNLPRIGDKPKPSDALRNSLRAPQGYVVGVADQSGIELRVNHFLWQVESSMQLYRASPDKADLYRAFASSLFGVPEAEITKPQRQVGKVAQLGLGFGAGAKTFRRIAKIMGGIDLPQESDDPDALTCESVVNTWRQTYAPIVDGWKQCGAALTDITQGVERAVDPWGLVTTHRDGLVLPSGRMIRYPGLRLVDDGQTWPDGRSKKSWVYGDGRHKTYLTGPKVTENCLAAGSLVLTDRGWVSIEDVTRDDLVHDGVEFVRHGGSVSRSVQTCVRVDGVYMTPDHEVLTDGGWQQAGENPRPYRPNIRHAHGVGAGGAGHTPGSRRAGAESRDGHQPINSVLPHQPRLVDPRVDTPASVRQQVYDILNCGPRQRFVVLGSGGPFIVHNCVQAIARDSVFEAALRFYKLTRLRPVMRVHDELIYMFPRSEAESLLAELQKILRSPPSWWPQLITWSEGDLADTYGAAK